LTAPGHLAQLYRDEGKFELAGSLLTKVIEIRRRFKQEPLALGRLQHPGIAQIYEANTGRTILGQIEQAAAHSIGGIFLFTRMTIGLGMAHGKEPFPETTWSSRLVISFDFKASAMY
jgi:hypothetical protein